MVRVGEKIADWQKNETNFKGGHLVYKMGPPPGSAANNAGGGSAATTTSLH